MCVFSYCLKKWKKWQRIHTLHCVSCRQPYSAANIFLYIANGQRTKKIKKIMEMLIYETGKDNFSMFVVVKSHRFFSRRMYYHFNFYPFICIKYFLVLFFDACVYAILTAIHFHCSMRQSV